MVLLTFVWKCFQDRNFHRVVVGLYEQSIESWVGLALSMLMGLPSTAEHRRRVPVWKHGTALTNQPTISESGWPSNLIEIVYIAIFDKMPKL